MSSRPASIRTQTNPDLIIEPVSWMQSHPPSARNSFSSPRDSNVTISAVGWSSPKAPRSMPRSTSTLSQHIPNLIIEGVGPADSARSYNQPRWPTRFDRSPRLDPSQQQTDSSRPAAPARIATEPPMPPTSWKRTEAPQSFYYEQRVASPPTSLPDDSRQGYRYRSNSAEAKGMSTFPRLQGPPQPEQSFNFQLEDKKTLEALCGSPSPEEREEYRQSVSGSELSSEERSSNYPSLIGNSSYLDDFDYSRSESQIFQPSLVSSSSDEAQNTQGEMGKKSVRFESKSSLGTAESDNDSDVPRLQLTARHTVSAPTSVQAVRNVQQAHSAALNTSNAGDAGFSPRSAESRSQPTSVPGPSQSTPQDAQRQQPNSNESTPRMQATSDARRNLPSQRSSPRPALAERSSNQSTPRASPRTSFSDVKTESPPRVSFNPTPISEAVKPSSSAIRQAISSDNDAALPSRVPYKPTPIIEGVKPAFSAGVQSSSSETKAASPSRVPFNPSFKPAPIIEGVKPPFTAGPQASFADESRPLNQTPGPFQPTTGISRSMSTPVISRDNATTNLAQLTSLQPKHPLAFSQLPPPSPSTTPDIAARNAAASDQMESNDKKPRNKLRKRRLSLGRTSSDKSGSNDQGSEAVRQKGEIVPPVPQIPTQQSSPAISRDNSSTNLSQLASAIPPSLGQQSHVQRTPVLPPSGNQSPVQRASLPSSAQQSPTQRASVQPMPRPSSIVRQQKENQNLAPLLSRALSSPAAWPSPVLPPSPSGRPKSIRGATQRPAVPSPVAVPSPQPLPAAAVQTPAVKDDSGSKFKKIAGSVVNYYKPARAVEKPEEPKIDAAPAPEPPAKEQPSKSRRKSFRASSIFGHSHKLSSVPEDTSDSKRPGSSSTTRSFSFMSPMTTPASGSPLTSRDTSPVRAVSVKETRSRHSISSPYGSRNSSPVRSAIRIDPAPALPPMPMIPSKHRTSSPVRSSIASSVAPSISSTSSANNAINTTNTTNTTGKSLPLPPSASAPVLSSKHPPGNTPVSIADLAAFNNSPASEVIIFRRFDAAHKRVLLEMQDQIVSLEAELHALDTFLNGNPPSSAPNSRPGSSAASNNLSDQPPPSTPTEVEKGQLGPQGDIAKAKLRKQQVTFSLKSALHDYDDLLLKFTNLRLPPSEQRTAVGKFKAWLTNKNSSTPTTSNDVPTPRPTTTATTTTVPFQPGAFSFNNLSTPTSSRPPSSSSSSGADGEALSMRSSNPTVPPVLPAPSPRSSFTGTRPLSSSSSYFPNLSRASTVSAYPKGVDVARIDPKLVDAAHAMMTGQPEQKVDSGKGKEKEKEKAVEGKPKNRRTKTR